MSNTDTLIYYAVLIGGAMLIGWLSPTIPTAAVGGFVWGVAWRAISRAVGRI